MTDVGIVMGLSQISEILKEINESLKIIVESVSKQEEGKEHIIFHPWTPEQSDD